VTAARGDSTAYVLTSVEEIASPDNRRLRAGLIGSQLTGVLMTRYLFGAPVLVGVAPPTRSWKRLLQRSATT
jgi:hypothetical protein